MSLFLAGCVSDPAAFAVPNDHPANPQAVEVAYVAPPNVLTLESSALAPPTGDSAKHDHHAKAPAGHSEHAQPKAAPQPEAAPPKHDDHANHKAIHVSEATQEQIDALVKAYLALTAMLAEDKTQGAADQLAAISKAAKALTEAKETEVKKVAEKIVKATPQKADELEHVRHGLKGLSDAVIELAQLAPPSKKVAATVYQANCPHAKASWLQLGEKIANPYYGSEMLRCGKVTAKIQAAEGHKH